MAELKKDKEFPSLAPTLAPKKDKEYNPIDRKRTKRKKYIQKEPNAKNKSI